MHLQSDLLRKRTNLKTSAQHEIITGAENQEPMASDTAPQAQWNASLILHDRHERRLADCKKDIHHLWHKIFDETPNETKTTHHRHPESAGFH